MIKLLTLDVDGILTNGKKAYDKYGNVISKSFCDKDWTAIKRFKSLGIQVIFLSGDSFNKGVADKRNIDIIINRSEKEHIDKSKYIDKICEKYNVSTEEIAFAGDDIFDLNFMKKIKYAFCPIDAPNIIKKNSVTLNCKGGDNFIMNLFDYLDTMKTNRLIPSFELQEHIDKVYSIDVEEKF
jgi:3-deoxy-D-manno-octulosonate 8-phosphate phosphatase (KDO 8-P phosphatase)